MKAPRNLHPVNGAHHHDGKPARVYPRVIVRKDPIAELQGGVVQPERFQRAHHDGQTTPWCATVIGSGSPDMRAGDRVLIERYAGSDILHDGERLTILPAHEVLAVIEPGEFTCSSQQS